MTTKDRIFEMLVLFYHWPKKVSSKTYRLWIFILLAELLIFWLNKNSFHTEQLKKIAYYFLYGIYALIGLNVLGYFLFHLFKRFAFFRLIPFYSYIFSIFFLPYFWTLSYDYRLVVQLPIIYLISFSFCVFQWIYQLYDLPRLKEKHGLDKNETLLNYYMTKQEKDMKYGNHPYLPFVVVGLVCFALMSIGYMLRHFIGYFLLSTFSNLGIIIVLGVCSPVSFTQAFDVFYTYYEENE